MGEVLPKECQAKGGSERWTAWMDRLYYKPVKLIQRIEQSFWKALESFPGEVLLIPI
jgi:hypothetical protein